MNNNGILQPAAGFAAVLAQWRDGTAPPGTLSDPPFERLSLALADPRASAMDRLVLLRHVLRYENLRVGHSVSAILSEALGRRAVEVGLDTIVVGPQRFEVTVRPWRPAWLERGLRAVDETAMRAPPRRFANQSGPLADPFLHALGRETYRSNAQQAAVRAVVSMPSGASLIVDLPTGEGKSTVFRTIARTGFAASSVGQKPGLVVVVVPTVTLALDHERTCGGSDTKPLAYVGGREARNALIRDAIRSGSQSLLFVAPEAVVQSLREPLGRIAKSGGLAALVIDEAHLVDGWGTGFRTAFQMLAGVVNAWRDESPEAERFRTIFLSATLSKGSLQTLQDLFSPSTEIPVVSGASVRPEPEYWIAESADLTTRQRRVEEALCYLPRPAILYVTKVADAEYWSTHLRSQGFGRLALVHGGTLADERERVLQHWSDAQVDIVVATSAFGLGIDYPHVRAVIHACLPETFDRFYQEVGRGGRDGCASISLLIPESSDARVSRGLSVKKVITIERGLKRWKAMFHHRATQSEGYPRYVVPIDVSPGYDEEDIDLIGERSTDWNLRVLALMARSGVIRLLGACVRDLQIPNAPQQFERIEILDERHLDPAIWSTRIESTRREISEQGDRAFRLLQRFATGRECPARLIGELYGTPNRPVALVCGGCRVCRDDPTQRLEDGFVPYRRPPWPVQAKIASAMDRIWGQGRYALVSYPFAAPGSRVVRDFVDALRRLDTYGLRLWVEVGAVAQWMREAATKALSGRPWMAFASETWKSVIWPEGARVIACGPEEIPSAALLAAGAQTSARIVLVPERAADPKQRDREIAAIVPGPVYTLQTFMSAVLQ
jgi:ATP-dependent DNA helicase RecQ